MRQKIVYFVSIILALLVGIFGTLFVQDRYFNNQEIIEQTIKNISISESTTIASAVDNIYDSTVYIECKGSLYNSTGSGFTYKVDDANGYIITNNHVIENSTSISIINSLGKTYSAVLLGADKYSDIAVLRVPKEAVLKVATIGESSTSIVGDTVFAVGTPVGVEYMNSVTKGTISGKNRTVEISVGNTKQLFEVMQVDAAINPGNSGGPLCNLKGEVIGVNSLKLVEEEVEGMGFAIPIETVMQLVESLELGKNIVRPYFGIGVISVVDTWQLFKNEIYLDNNINSGIVITIVDSSSVAALAGLRKGDVLLEIDNTEIKSTVHFNYLLNKHKVGDKVKIKYYRNKEYKEIEVILSQSDE